MKRMRAGRFGLLTAVPYAAAVIAMIAVSAASDRLAHRRVFTWVPLLIAAIGFAVSYLTRGGTFTTAFILLIIAAAAMCAVRAVLRVHPRATPGRRRRPGVGMINAFGALGGFIGTYIVGALGGGTSAVPFVFLAACLFAAALLMFAVSRPRQAHQAARPAPKAGRGDADRVRAA